MTLLMKVIRIAKDPCSICGQGRARMLILSSMPNSEVFWENRQIPLKRMTKKLAWPGFSSREKV